MRKHIDSFPIMALITLLIFVGFPLASWSRRVSPTTYASGAVVDAWVSGLGSQNLKGGSFPAASFTTPTLWQTVSLNALHGWPSAVGNHLKIFDAAVDETRNRIYVQSILTDGIAVIDGATDTLIGSLASGIGNDNYHLTYLAVQPAPPIQLPGGRSETVPPLNAPLALDRSAHPQIGLNFIRFYWDSSNDPHYQPGWIFSDFAKLGVQTFRQFVKADLLWKNVEPQDNRWHWSEADAVIANPNFEPIVTLFAMQYTSPTPPWATTPSQFQKTLGPEARDYLQHVIARYGPYVKYWEIGNEMDHWRAADPGNRHPLRFPPAYPVDGFSPQEQGAFLAQVADFIRQRDPDAVIIIPGMGGLSDYTLNNWFAGVITGGGSDWFDVINYHFYGAWQSYAKLRKDLEGFIIDHGLGDKPVWLTETGSTASPTLTSRTDYPNSPPTQAADVFRRLIQAYGYGDSLAIWHTYIGSDDLPSNPWRLYGLRTDAATGAQAQPAYYSFKLLAQELIPFAQVKILAGQSGGVNNYEIITQTGAKKYVAWGSGNLTIPSGITQMTSVIPLANGSFSWQPVQAGQTITLSPYPVLLK